MRTIFIFVLALIIALPAPTQAQDYKTLLDIPEGSTLINLSATERVEIEQDLLIANLSFKHESKDPKVVQDKINTVMQKALDKAKSVTSVKAITQQYYVHEYDRNRSKDRSRRDMVWRGQQGLQIKGKKADDLLKLAGELQELGMAMNGLSYSVSPELLEETRNNMLEDALAKLVTKAERTAKTLGKKETEFLQINVDMGRGGYQQPHMMRAMSMDAGMAQESMAAPVAAPGESTITMTVSANALLSD